MSNPPIPQSHNPRIPQSHNPTIPQSLNPTILLSLPWLAPYLALFRLAPREPDLSSAPRSTGRKLSLIIPARNESRTITTVVRSILQTTYSPLEILVVDDRSTDNTASIVEQLTLEDTRLRLVHGAELPEGWYGKQWACLQGYREASGEILVFTDADTRHQPELLAHAVGALEQAGVDLVTVAPHQRCESFWERVVMPQVWLLLGLRYHPRVVNRAARPRDVIANGQFILVTRTSYDRAGTHEAVRQEVAEDLALAQAYHRAGFRIHFAFAQRLMETRMYHDLRHLIEGWSKNVYLGGRQSYPDEPVLRALVPAILAGAMCFWLLPPLLLGLALAAVPHLMAGAAIATLACVLFWMLMSHGMEIPIWYGLFYPLGAAMTLYVVLRSTWRGGKRVEWKGRVYGERGTGKGGREKE